MTKSVEEEEDPRLEYLPVVLIVTTNGVEVELLLPPTPTANIHWAQAWKPIACRCGVAHAPCDPAELVLVIGDRDHGLHYHPGAFVVFVVSRRTYRLPAGAAQIVYSGMDTFGAWAADVVLNLVGPQSDASVWRYNLADLKRMMTRETTWSCVAASGDLGSMAGRIASLVPSSADELHVSLAVPDNSTVYIADVGDTLQAIARAVKPDANIICSSSWATRLRVTTIYPV